MHLLPLFVSLVVAQTAGPDPGAVQWAKRAAVTVRTVAPTDEDFSDLQPLKRAIGTARIVQLGELTHGDGTGFQAKARLIRFLHKEMGFDVVVWESGLFDCEEMNKAIASDRPLAQAAAMGAFPHWSASADSFPLFEYARASHKTRRPLQMTGFDIQFSGSIGASRLRTFVGWFDSVDRSIVPDALYARINSVLETERKRKGPFKGQQDYVQWLQDSTAPAVDLYALYEANKDRFSRRFGARDAAYKGRFIANMRDFKRMVDNFSNASSYEIRESSNADNVRYLLDHRYKGKKLILWAHNGHIFHGAERPNGAKSTGGILREALGDQIYTIGFMAYEGAWSWMGNPPVPYVVPAPDAVESVFHAVGKPYLFLDIRPVRRQRSAWLAQPRAAYLSRQGDKPMTAVWPHLYDGVFYIDRMAPRAPLKRPAPEKKP